MSFELDMKQKKTINSKIQTRMPEWRYTKSPTGLTANIAPNTTQLPGFVGLANSGQVPGNPASRHPVTLSQMHAAATHGVDTEPPRRLLSKFVLVSLSESDWGDGICRTSQIDLLASTKPLYVHEWSRDLLVGASWLQVISRDYT